MKRSDWLWIVGIAVLFGIFVAIQTDSEDTDGSTYEAQSNSRSSYDYEDRITMACVMSQEFVKRELRAPSTAEFPACYTAAVEYIGNRTFTVNSHVDAQNGFGAQIRSNYLVELRDDGSDKWSLLDIYIE